MNSLVLKDTLQPCFYRFCLIRILQTIADMRNKWPSRRIVIGKTYLDAAYQRVHKNAQIADTCIKIVGKPAFLCLRLPFGNTPAPSEYTIISEAETDLGNNLLADTSRDAKNLQSPHQKLLPREGYLPASDPLVKEDHIVVNIEAKDSSMYGFIDEIITITIDNLRLVECTKNTALLIIYTIFRPRKSDKPLKRDDPLLP